MGCGQSLPIIPESKNHFYAFGHSYDNKENFLTVFGQPYTNKIHLAISKAIKKFSNSNFSYTGDFELRAGEMKISQVDQPNVVKFTLPENLNAEEGKDLWSSIFYNLMKIGWRVIL